MTVASSKELITNRVPSSVLYEIPLDVGVLHLAQSMLVVASFAIPNMNNFLGGNMV